MFVQCSDGDMLYLIVYRVHNKYDNLDQVPVGQGMSTEQGRTGHISDKLRESEQSDQVFVGIPQHDILRVKWSA